MLFLLRIMSLVFKVHFFSEPINIIDFRIRQPHHDFLCNYEDAPCIPDFNDNSDVFINIYKPDLISRQGIFNLSRQS